MLNCPSIYWAWYNTGLYSGEAGLETEVPQKICHHDDHDHNDHNYNHYNRPNWWWRIWRFDNDHHDIFYNHYDYDV